ncbi:histidine kinase [Adlercreutzia sp. ZJ473]|uniref:histidine kinase n=1 Tax=Adlercreutzia sp. ZJ473 TaxID=2722822 RepID=UPI001551DFB7|nr:histidine kinase [Adlercreutzia sp. ZJ473]
MEEIIDTKKNRKRMTPRFFNLEMLALTIAALAALVMVGALMSPTVSVPTIIVAGVIFTLSLVIVMRLLNDPDSVRAHQSDAMLQLSSATLDLMQEGLNHRSAQDICELLLPNTAAIAVAITDKEKILGYAGFQEADNPAGADIRTQATHDTIADGVARVLYSAEEIGFPEGASTIKAAIIVPLRVGSNVEGTLKFYYRSAKKITETQKSIAQGFGRLLSTQMAAAEMENQRKLATSMELKMLQSQINPHFLFNTINTIASLIRTDPMKARTLLREFAVFYRRTLEDSSERIMLSREIEQTMRYFSFEVARFGEDRVGLCVGAGPELQDMMVPPFILQPLVENAVRHAMPSEGKLIISILAEVDGDDVVVSVSDDGVGMDEQTCNNIMHPESSTGMGIAVKNVHDRMKGFFGERADMRVESELGRGTTVTLRFPDCAVRTVDPIL